MASAQMEDLQNSRLLIHLNALLTEDISLSEYLPLNVSDFAQKCQNGVIFCKLINILVPGMIPLKRIHDEFGDVRRRHFKMLENYSLVMEAASKLRCSLINIQPLDLINGKENLLYGLLWQLVKNGSMTKLGESSDKNSDNTGKTVKDTADNSLLQWINSSVKECQLGDFKKGLADSFIYFQLINQLFPDIVEMNENEFRSIEDPLKRATIIVELGTRILGPLCILEPVDIVNGNETMNVLFLASLCRTVAKDMASALQSERVDHQAACIDYEREICELTSQIEKLLLENESLKEEERQRRTLAVDISIDLEEEEEKEEVDWGTECDPTDGAGVEERNDCLMNDSLSITNTESDSSVECQSILITEGRRFGEGTKGEFNQQEEKLRLSNHSALLYQIFHQTKKLLPLTKIIYSNLSVPIIIAKSTMSGHLRKRSSWGSRWNNRFAIIRDNFIFFYEKETSRKPTSVEKLDNALVGWEEGNNGNDGDCVIWVEVCSAVQPHYFYISERREVLLPWMQAIQATSAYWNRYRKNRINK